MSDPLDLAVLISPLVAHYYCDDCWYSCPLAEDGCCNDGVPKGICNCGQVEKVQAIVDALTPLLDELEATRARVTEQDELIAFLGEAQQGDTAALTRTFAELEATRAALRALVDSTPSHNPGAPHWAAYRAARAVLGDTPVTLDRGQVADLSQQLQEWLTR